MGRQKQQPLEHRLLLTATFCLLAGGAVMVYSASSARTLLEGQGDGTGYLVKYVLYGAVGLVVMHKLALVLHAAAALSARPKIARSLRDALGPIILPGVAAAGLIVLQPDLGTAL